MEYQIVNADSIVELEENVRVQIGEGWIPQGGVCSYTRVSKAAGLRIVEVTLVQAMVRLMGDETYGRIRTN